MVEARLECRSGFLVVVGCVLCTSEARAKQAENELSFPYDPTDCRPGAEKGEFYQRLHDLIKKRKLVPKYYVR